MTSTETLPPSLEITTGPKDPLSNVGNNNSKPAPEEATHQEPKPPSQPIPSHPTPPASPPKAPAATSPTATPPPPPSPSPLPLSSSPPPQDGDITEQVLPPIFKKEGKALLQRLQDESEFALDKHGNITISGEQLENYNIREFLRATCIPFHTGQIPVKLQAWLRKKGITKFRNHRQKLMVPWQKRYSWRESTKAKRQRRSEAPGPSTNGPKP